MSMTMSEAQAYFTQMAEKLDPVQQDRFAEALAAVLRDAAAGKPPASEEAPSGMTLEDAMDTLASVRAILATQGGSLADDVQAAVNVLIGDAVEQQRKKAQRSVDEANKILEQRRAQDFYDSGFVDRSTSTPGEPQRVAIGTTGSDDGPAPGFLSDLQAMIELLGPVAPKLIELYEKKLASDTDATVAEQQHRIWREQRTRTEQAWSTRLAGLVEMATLVLRGGGKLPTEALDELDRAAQLMTRPVAVAVPGSAHAHGKCEICDAVRKGRGVAPAPAPARGPFARPSAPSAPGDVVPLRPPVAADVDEPSVGDGPAPPPAVPPTPPTS